jgi:hypothetical protein
MRRKSSARFVIQTRANVKAKDVTSYSAKPRKVLEAVRLMLCFGAYLVEDVTVFLYNNFVVCTLYVSVPVYV